ncbi:hypothetical protein LAZ67_3003933 [Cordylochernes scorpioides]|uniref:RNA-directed DNA polymerase n=1 Tax=Cordylochernes scorpioides TaxID=51811 RepID=A0ABY6K9R2_9ARAC|nr:hypothetical protein LAZ67_3003933 [Cordylochernes scorpioides]
MANTTITKLNGANYSSWSFQIKLVLIENDLWSLINPGEAKPDPSDLVATKLFLSREGKAFAKICLGINDEQQFHVQHLNTPKEVWEEMEKLYAPKDSRYRAVLLRRQLYGERLTQHSNMEGYMGKINQTVNELALIGDKIDDGDLAMVLLGGLPEDWDTVVSNICNLPDSDFTTATVKRRLFAEAERRSSNLPKDVGAMIVNASSKPIETEKQFKAKVVCFKCGGNGHYARECRNKGKNEQRPKMFDQNKGVNMSAMCNTLFGATAETWIIDSGATHHMTPKRDYFTCLKECTSNMSSITVANGSSIEACGIGTVSAIIVGHKGDASNLVAQNTLYVPDMRHSVLSVLQMIENGRKVVFNRSGCHIMDMKGKLLIEGKKLGRLYYVQTTPSSPIDQNDRLSLASECKEELTLELWHKRLMHVNAYAIAKMAKNQSVRGLDCSPAKPEKCEVCLIGKSYRLPFLQHSHKEEKEIMLLDLVHADLMGPLDVLSRGGAKYVLTIIDESTRYASVFFSEKNKAGTLGKVKEWIQESEKQTSRKLKRIRTDNGLEFCSKEWDTFCTSVGIVHEHTMTYTPQQNGVAERMNRTLLDLFRSTISGSGLPKASWAELTYTAAYVRNRVLNDHNGESRPYELWTGNKPSLKHIRAIGCQVFVHIPRQVRKSKLERRAVKGNLVGYALRGGGYRVWIPDRKKVLIVKIRSIFSKAFLSSNPLPFIFKTPSRVLVIPHCMLNFPLKRLRFKQSSPFSSNYKKFRNDIVTDGISRQDIMEIGQDSIGVKTDNLTKERGENGSQSRENEPTGERQEVREGNEQETSPLVDVIQQFAAALAQGRSCDPTGPTISPFDGTYSATQFFQTFDRKMEDASMEEPEKLLRLPNYLVRQPLELFRKLRLADRSYFQVRQILLDLYPESSEASFAKYFAMKLTGQANLETNYRHKTAMGLQLGLPQEVILETLTEGLPFSDQRLVRVVPPENLGEWFRLVQRIHGPSVHGMHLFRRPTVSSAARGTGTANADIDQSRRPTKKNGQCNQSHQTDTKAFGQCKQSQNNQSRVPSNQVKPETPQPSRLFETEVGSLTQLTVKLFLAPNIPCPFLIDTGASLNIVPYNLYHMLKTHLPNLTLKGHSLDLQTLNGFAKTMGKLSIPLTIGQITRRENFHVVNAPLPFGILSINSLHKFRLEIDFNKCTIFQLGAPLSTPSYHFNHVPNVCTYWQCQAMSQRIYPASQPSAYDNHCVHSLKKNPLSTCHFFTKANCLFYMPSNNKATTASTCKHHAQNVPTERDNSHTKHIGDHTSSHNYHMTNPHNELDTHTKTQQNPLPHTCYNTTHNPLYAPQFTTLLQRYTHIFTQNKFNVPCLRIPPVKIPTNSEKIITIRPYRVPICDQQEIRNQVQQMLENGIIEQSFSPFSSPVTLVTKRDKTKRFCIDYRKVNELISSDVHPLPRIEDILDRLAQANICHPRRIIPTHSITFRIKNHPQIYERAISQVLQRHGLDCVAHYFNDFIIYSNTLEEHQNHLRQFFAFCEAEKLQLNFAKCEFFKQSIDFLGYTITAGTTTPLTRNTDIIHAIKQPHNRKTLQSFLGAVNVYNKFIPEYARLRAPLNNLLKKDVVWIWDEACQKAFIDLKGNLTQHPILHLYKEGLPCQVYCDASTLGIAGILKQVHPDGNVYPVQYFSRTLRPHEKNYSISELECLAIVESVEKFRIYLMGRKFTIFSDHHALQWLKTIKNPSGRLFRWSLRLSSYEYEVRYIKGKQQYEADLLSCNPFCGFLDATLIKTHQPPPSRESSLTIDRNGLHTVSRKDLPHLPINKRPLGPTYGELSQPPEAKEPFDLLSLDTIAGFAKYGNTKIYLHVVVDHFSHYAWTFPSKSTSITTYQQVLKRVLQDGSPKRLLTDRAPAFTSPKFSSFLLNRNIHPLLTTSNNPQANGLCERLNATLTGKLRLLHLENPKIAWTKLVKRVTIIYNKTPHSPTGFPPVYLMFGTLPSEISNHSTPYPDIDKARKIAHTRTQNKHLQDKNIYDQRHKQPHFEVGDLVLVKLYHHPNTGKLAPYFTGPHTVLEIISPNVVRIDRPNQPLQRDTDTIHVNKLKLYTETVRYISPPAVSICHIKHKPDYTFPFKHLTPELFPADPLRFKPTNSEPFRHFDPAIFATRRFAPFFPDIKNCEPDHHSNPIVLSQKSYTPLPNDNKQCEIERPTMNKVRTNICLLVLPYKCIPVLFLSYLLTYTMPANRIFELQEAVFHFGQAFVKLIVILGSIFAENLNKFRGDRNGVFTCFRFETGVGIADCCSPVSWGKCLEITFILALGDNVMKVWTNQRGSKESLSQSDVKQGKFKPIRGGARRYRNARAIETPLQSETRRALRRLRYSEARVAATQTMQVPVQRIQLWTHKPFSGLQYNAHIDYKADSSVDIGQMSRVCQT